MMVRAALPVLFWVLGGGSAAAQVSELHHRIDAYLDPGAGTLVAEDTMTITANDYVTVGLGPQFFVEAIEVDGETVTGPPAGESWTLSLGVGGRHTVTVRYRGELATAAPGSGVLGRAMADAQGSLLPGGASSFTFEIDLATPESQRIVTSGELVSEGVSDGSYRARFRHEFPTDEIVLVAGPFEVTERQHSAVRLRTYFHSEVAELADAYLQKSKEYLDLYDSWIGAYPYSAFHIVSGPLPVGLGFVNFTYIGTRVLRLPFIRHTSLGHEVLHNWWGNGGLVSIGKGETGPKV